MSDWVGTRPRAKLDCLNAEIWMIAQQSESRVQLCAVVSSSMHTPISFREHEDALQV